MTGITLQEMAFIFSILFLSDPELRRKWTAAIRREEREGEFKVSDPTVVCSD